MSLLFMDGFDAGDYLIKGWAASSMNTGNASPATRFGSGRWASNPGNFCMETPGPSIISRLGFLPIQLPSIAVAR